MLCFSEFGDVVYTIWWLILRGVFLLLFHILEVCVSGEFCVSGTVASWSIIGHSQFALASLRFSQSELFSCCGNTKALKQRFRVKSKPIRAWSESYPSDIWAERSCGAPAVALWTPGGCITFELSALYISSLCFSITSSQTASECISSTHNGHSPCSSSTSHFHFD